MNNELQHFGILGMKWGVRRFQNNDGSLTPAGEKRYSHDSEIKKARHEVNSARLNYQSLRERYMSTAEGSVNEGKRWAEMHKAEMEYFKIRELANKKTSREKAITAVSSAIGIIGAIYVRSLLVGKK